MSDVVLLNGRGFLWSGRGRFENLRSRNSTRNRTVLTDYKSFRNVLEAAVSRRFSCRCEFWPRNIYLLKNESILKRSKELWRYTRSSHNETSSRHRRNPWGRKSYWPLRLRNCESIRHRKPFSNQTESRQAASPSMLPNDV